IKVGRLDRPQALDSLRAEGEALIRVGPPHVPTCFETGVLDGGAPYLVMELLSLPSLAERLEALESGMDEAEFAWRARAILAAVRAVHHRGLVHQDLKPENIFLGGSPPLAKLVDFGTARSRAAAAASERPSPPAPSDADLVLGTAEYMAPEP